MLISRQACGTLLTDLNPHNSSTAQASYNLVRCALAAGGVAILQFFINAIGVGWCFTLYGGVCLATIPLIWMLRTKGMGWRQSKAQVVQAEAEDIGVGKS